MDGKLSEKHEKHEEKSEWHQKGGDSSTSWQRVMKVTKRTETKMSSKTEQKNKDLQSHRHNWFVIYFHFI